MHTRKDVYGWPFSVVFLIAPTPSSFPQSTMIIIILLFLSLIKTLRL